jgi:hypothetical protein
MRPQIKACLDAGVLTQGDVRRLLRQLTSDPKVLALAERFGTSPAQMAEFALDAGLVFLRVCLLSMLDAAPAVTLSPGPVADAGWDIMADVPEDSPEWLFYVGVCQRFSEFLGVPVVVIRHHKFNDTERIMARDLGAVLRVVQAMDHLGLAYVPEHWRLSDDPTCQGTGGDLPCGFRRDRDLLAV